MVGRQELEHLYQRERDRLFTYALSILRDQHLAEDVVQDVFQKLWRHAGEPRDLRTYVYACVRNRALDVRREARSRETASLEPSEHASIYSFDGSVPWSGLLSEERARQVEQAMGQLSEEEREVVVLHVYGELTFESMASVLKAPLGTVVSRYRRALVKLRKALGGETSP
jgi:RNA polymerase sigma-70 factor (ECF subfamily)